jgi:hypothetical protein
LVVTTFPHAAISEKLHQHAIQAIEYAVSSTQPTPVFGYPPARGPRPEWDFAIPVLPRQTEPALVFLRWRRDLLTAPEPGLEFALSAVRVLMPYLAARGESGIDNGHLETTLTLHSGPMKAEVPDGTGRLARTISRFDTPVLLWGGDVAQRDAAARYIHDKSPLRDRQFVTVDCAARSDVWFLDWPLSEDDDHSIPGTLYLRDVESLNAQSQARLWQIVGQNSSGRRNPRIVAGTHGELLNRVGSGVFREDVYFGLAANAMILQQASPPESLT